MNAPLEAVSTVIELKPEKKYLLVFKDDEDAISVENLGYLLDALKSEGIWCVGLALRKGQELEVIEVLDSIEEQAE